MTRPHKWLVVRVTAPSADLAALLAEGLFVFGAQGVEEKDGKLITYLPPPAQSTEEYVDALRAHLQAHTNQEAVDVEWEWELNRDWAEEWKRGLAPRRVGEKLIIAPSWTQPEPQPGDIVITIDPQMAFGTGEHASTRGILRLLEQWIKPGDVAINVGAGSAVLAIAAARLGAARVRAVEYDSDAVINAHENLAENEVEDRVSIDCMVVDDQYMRDAGTFDLILANILSGVIVPLLPAFRSSLRADGRLIVAGILLDEAVAFRAAAQLRGFTVKQEDREEEWWSAVLLPSV